MIKRGTGRFVVALSAAVLAAGAGAGFGQTYTPSSGGSLQASRPSVGLNQLNRVGFSWVGRQSFDHRSSSVVAHQGISQSSFLTDYAQGSPLGTKQMTALLPGAASLSSGTFIRHVRSTTDPAAALLARRARNPELFRASELTSLFSRHSVPASDQIDDLPYSVGAALSSRGDVVASRDWSDARPFDAGPAESGDTDGGINRGGAGTLGDAMDRRLAARREELIYKGRVEFQTGDYQRAFGQFVLASSIVKGAEQDPRRLILLTSIAAGNYARGAQTLRVLVNEDDRLFEDDYYGVEWLYPETMEIGDTTVTRDELFERHIIQLRAFRARSYGDASALMVYPYALWLTGKHKDAMLATREIIDKATHPVIVEFASKMLEKMNRQGHEAKDESNWSGVWAELLK